MSTDNTNATNVNTSSGLILHNPDEVCQDSKSTQTYSTTSTFSGLTSEHQADIAARGIFPKWAFANCMTCDIPKASLVLDYKAYSPGIMLMSDCYGQWQFRPDDPWHSKGKEDKDPPKYRTPKGEYDLFLAKHPDIPAYWEDLDALKARCFTINGKPYLLLTEGGFKAIIGCQNDIPTVAVPGVTMGLTPKAKGEPDLVPALKRLAEAGFNFIIAFDSDRPDKTETLKNVRYHEAKLTKVLKSYGCDVLSVTGKWSHEDGKGMDDFIQNKEIQAFRAILMKADANTETLDTNDSPAKAKKPPSRRVIAAQLTEHYGHEWKYDDEQKVWRIYSGKHWEKVGLGAFTSLVKTVLDAKNINYEGSAYVKDVVELLELDLRQIRWQHWDRTQFINFSNCVLDGKTGKTLEHSPGTGFTSYLPYEYKPLTGDLSDPLEALRVNCPNRYKHLRTVMRGDERKMLKMLAISNGILKYRFFDLQMFVHFVGAPGSGKGTEARFQEKLVGRDNFKGCQLDRLSDGSTRASVVDKQLVVFADERKPVGVESILSFTGGDAVSYRELHTPAADAFFYGLFLICSNKPIFVGDTTGLERRLCLVHFDNPIPTEKRDYSIESEFEPEIPAYIAIALSLSDILVTQLLRGIGSERIADFKAKEWEMKCETNSVAAFFDTNLVLDSIATAPTLKLYEAYKNWCETSGLKPLSVVKFPKYLADLLSDENLPAKWVKARTSSFEGLRLRRETDEHPTHSQVLDGSAPVEAVFCTSSAPVDAPVKPLHSNTLHQLHQLEAKYQAGNSSDENSLLLPTEKEEENPPPSTGATGANPLPATNTTGAASGEQVVQSIPSTGASIGEGDKVEITYKGDYQGQKGLIANIGHGARETDYYVQLEGEKVLVSVPFGAMQFAYLRKL